MSGLAALWAAVVVSGLTAATGAAQERAAGALTVSAAGFGSDDGKAVVILLDSEKGMKALDFRKDRAKWEGHYKVADVSIKDGQAKAVFDKLLPGEYVVVVCHDKNQDQKVDSNLVGLPTEPLALSNGVKVQHFPHRIPKWDDAKISVAAGKNAAAVKMPR
jgi:uncharacterized protein (DUF2141 family)